LLELISVLLIEAVFYTACTIWMSNRESRKRTIGIYRKYPSDEFVSEFDIEDGTEFAERFEIREFPFLLNLTIYESLLTKLPDIANYSFSEFDFYLEWWHE
jgi:hypothetical protein